MDLKNIISIGTVLCFVIYILLGSNPRKNYLLFVLFTFPFIDLFATPVELGGFKVFNVITIISLPLFIRKSGSADKEYKYYSVVFAILSSILFLGALGSEFMAESLISLSQFLCVLVYSKLMMDECKRDGSFVRTAIKAFKLSCTLSLIFLVFQLLFGLSVSIYELNPNASMYDGLIRYPSFFQDPQKYGQFLAMSSFLFLIEMPGEKKYPFNIIAFLVVIIALFLTGVRAAFSGLIVGVVIIFLFGKKEYILAGIACFAIGFTVIYFYSSHFAMFNRGANVNDSADVRYAYWRGALRIFFERPLLGIGIGNYQHYVTLHEQDQYWEYFGTIEYIDHPESGYLKILTEFGVFGAFIGLLIILQTFVSAFKTLIFSGLQDKTLLFLTASLLSWGVAFLTVYSFSDLRIFIMVATIICLILSKAKSGANPIINEV
jgi:O-antigen ligase